MQKTKFHSNTKLRGSVMVYVLMMVFLVTIIVCFSAQFGMSTIRNERQAEDFKVIQAAFDAATSQASADLAAGTLTLPTTRAVSINGVTGSETISDNTATITGTILITATLSSANGRTLSLTGYCEKAHIVSPWDYAIFTDNDFAPAKSITAGTLGGTNGGVFANGAIAWTAGTLVYGNSISTGAQSAGAVVSGTTVTNGAAPCSFPVVVASDYSAVATTTYNSSTTLNGVTFSSVASGSPYPVIYIAGNLTISGTISGVGTIFVDGSVTVSGSMTYANSSSHIAIISDSAASTTVFNNNVVGFWYSPGTIQDKGVTVSGNICAEIVQFKQSSASVVGDQFVENNTTEGVNMHLPGLWGSGGYTFLKNGSATSYSNGVQLVSSGSNQAGTAYISTKLAVTSFTIGFDMDLGTTGEGCTLIFQNSASTAVGGSGAGLGSSGIGNSVAIKFDIFADSTETNDSTGAYNNGATPTTPSQDLTGTVTLNSGDAFYVQCVYNGSTFTENITDLVTQATVTKTYSGSIPTIIGSNTAWFGFTGSTGSSSSTKGTVNITNVFYTSP